MRKVESLVVKYVGYSEPETEAEVNLELLGLETAIAAAKQRIAVLKQSLYLQSLAKQSETKEPADEKIVEEAPNADENKQKG